MDGSVCFDVLDFNVWFLSLSHTKNTWKELRIAVFDVCAKNLLTVYFFSLQFFFFYSYHHNVTISFSSGITFFIYILFILLLRLFTSLKVTNCITFSIILTIGGLLFFAFLNINDGPVTLFGTNGTNSELGVGVHICFFDLYRYDSSGLVFDKIFWMRLCRCLLSIVGVL